MFPDRLDGGSVGPAMRGVDPGSFLSEQGVVPLTVLYSGTLFDVVPKSLDGGSGLIGDAGVDSGPEALRGTMNSKKAGPAPFSHDERVRSWRWNTRTPCP